MDPNPEDGTSSRAASRPEATAPERLQPHETVESSEAGPPSQESPAESMEDDSSQGEYEVDGLEAGGAQRPGAGQEEEEEEASEETEDLSEDEEIFLGPRTSRSEPDKNIPIVRPTRRFGGHINEQTGVFQKQVCLLSS